MHVTYEVPRPTDEQTARHLHIAQVVMGWTPSVDPHAAAELRERLRALGWRCSVSELHRSDEPRHWNCRLTPDDTSAYVYAVGATPEEALVLAAEIVAEQIARANQAITRQLA